MTSTTPLLDIENLTVRLGGACILEDINISVETDEFIALIGPNGAGKTTLLRTIAGLLSFRGRIRIAGDPIATLSPQARARLLAYLPQGHTVHWPMNVEDIVALGRLPYQRALQKPNVEDQVIVMAAIASTELDAFLGRSFDTLSGGEQARVMLARALAGRAPLLLADEPTASLDPYHQLHVLELMQDHVKSGHTVIAVLHNLQLARQFADRLIVLNGGRIAADGSPEAVLTMESLESIYRVRPCSKTGKEVDLFALSWQRVDDAGK